MKNDEDNSKYKKIIELTDKSDITIIDNKQSKSNKIKKETEDVDEDVLKKFQNKNIKAQLFHISKNFRFFHMQKKAV